MPPWASRVAGGRGSGPAAGSVSGLAAAFLAGVSLNKDGGSGGSGSDLRAEPSRVAFQADLQPAKSCDDLLASYVARGKKLVGPWGWGGDLMFRDYAVADSAAPIELNGLRSSAISQSAKSASGM